MTYQVKEIYYTLQGEGARTGRAAVFLRFAGCNLWSGLERDRAGAVCTFCDTDFVGTDGPGGGKFADARSAGARGRGCVADGQRCATLCRLHGRRTAAAARRGADRRAARKGIRDRHRNQRHASAAAGHRLDLRQPQGERRIGSDARPGAEACLSASGRASPSASQILLFDHFFLQPMDGPEREANTRAATDYCLAHPQWRLSLQTHKLIGIR